MNLKKITIVMLSVSSIATSAFASSPIASEASVPLYSSAYNLTTDIRQNTVGNGSETASFYYKIGVSSFEKGNLDKAEIAFEKVLLARGLNQQAHYYLAFIAEQKGDDRKVLEHVKAFHGIQD